MAMKTYKISTVTQWIQEYEVQANTEEEAKNKLRSGDPDNITPLDGEYCWDTETINSVEEITETAD